MNEDWRVPRWLIVFIAVGIVLIIGGVSFIVYRDVVNNDRCQVALGPGAEWAGKDSCQPAPVRVDGLV